jgi:hypothetical protein
VPLPGVTYLAEVAGFLRHRLAAVDALWRRAAADAGPFGDDGAGADLVVIAAAAPFAATSFARARLLRQLHACGLLTDGESAQAERLLGVAGSR